MRNGTKEMGQWGREGGHLFPPGSDKGDHAEPALGARADRLPCGYSLPRERRPRGCGPSRGARGGATRVSSSLARPNRALANGVGGGRPQGKGTLLVAERRFQRGSFSALGEKIGET